MVKVLWHWQTPNSYLHGFKYLWLKTVEGFVPSVHCARCFKGSYSKTFGLKMPVNANTWADYEEGTLLYFCGVSAPYRWANNFHLAGRVRKDAPAKVVTLWNGDTITVLGLDVIEIDASIAEKAFPDLGKEYLTCRNFQFGAQMFPAKVPA